MQARLADGWAGDDLRPIAATVPVELPLPARIKPVAAAHATSSAAASTPATTTPSQRPFSRRPAGRGKGGATLSTTEHKGTATHSWEKTTAVPMHTAEIGRRDASLLGS